MPTFATEILKLTFKQKLTKMKNLKLISVLTLGLMLALVSCNKEDKAKRENADKILDLAESAIETDGKNFEKTILAQGFVKEEASEQSVGRVVPYSKGDTEGWALTYRSDYVIMAVHMTFFKSSQYSDYLNEFVISTDQILKRYKLGSAGTILTSVTELQTTNMSQFKKEAKNTKAADFTDSKKHNILATALGFDRAGQAQIQFNGNDNFAILLGASNDELY